VTKLILFLLLVMLAVSRPMLAQAPPPPVKNTGQSVSPPPGPENPSRGQEDTLQLTAIVERIVARENQLLKNLRNYSPRIETYIQNFRPDPELGSVPTDDRYFLGRLDFQRGIVVRSFLPQPSLPRRIVDAFSGPVTSFYSMHYQQRSFAHTIVMDTNRFDRQHYDFQFVRREFLGEIRCLVFDVASQKHAGTDLFKGRIWAEDQDYNIVRFNGTYAPAPKFSTDFHFDSWRENLQPGLWLPVYAYSEEVDLEFGAKRALRFKSQTRLWGYEVSNPTHQRQLTRVLVDAPAPVRDNGDDTQDTSPVSRVREWEDQAEVNVLERLQKAGLIAPAGDEVDKVLETVLNNLVLSNHLENLPAVHGRVLLTSPLESLFVGNTIVISRGLIDVLPDESSLAMVLSHELAHVVLRHNLTPRSTQYAFHDRLLVPDEDVLRHLDLRPTQQEEAAADAKAIELLKNSPYKDKLDKAGLFLRAMAATAPRTPQLFGAHLGTRLAQGEHVRHMAELMSSAPELLPTRIEQIAALPLGARIKVDAWSDRIRLVKSKPVTLLSAREKMPFEVTPLFPYLIRFRGAPQNVREETLAQ
jgi:hypothetical protein